MTTRGEMFATAAAIVRQSESLSRIWPDYWPKDQAFIINIEGTGALLISPGPKPASFRPIEDRELPPELAGKAFFHAGPLGHVQRPFAINYPLGDGKTAILVNARGEGATATIALILHEQFHAYQEGAFEGREPQFVDPLAVKDRVAFAAGAETERRLLIKALSAGSDEAQGQFVRQYFALRRERERSLPADVVRVEKGFERTEGTASFVEKAGLAAISGQGAAGLRRLLIEQLGKDLAGDDGAFATNWFRTRAYGTGAALAYLVDRHRPGTWRSAVESGAPLDALLRTSLGADAAPDEAQLARTARGAAGYDVIQRRLAPVIRAAEKTEVKSVADFLALGAVQIVFEPGAAGIGARPGFDAVGLFALSPGTLALRRATVFDMAGRGFSLVVRGRPVLLQPGSVTALLPTAPSLAEGKLTAGQHRLDRLRLSGDGYELRVSTPVAVSVEPGRVLVRMAN